MRKGGFGVAAKLTLIAAVMALIAILPACGNKTTATTTFPVPGGVTLSPTPAMSLEIGTNQSFTATVSLPNRTTSTQPVFYQSSNTAVVTVAANGLACAGSWDNLTSPTVCTPGPVGTSQVIATAQGVSSPATTVYVHQHIDQITLTLVLPPNSPPPTSACSSIGQSAIYEAHAFSRGVDITSTVGPFTFSTVNTTVAKLSNTASVLNNFVNGVSQNQIQITAAIPGTTPLFATVGTAVSVPINFNTCQVQSIELTVSSSTSTSRTITPTVVDSNGTTIVGVPLTWSSSQPASVSVSTSGVATASSGGGSAAVIASCTPPTCNIGILPTLPIYPENVIQVIPTTTNGTTQPSGTVYVSSSSCGTTDNCITTLVPVAVPANTLGTAIVLPTTPNSLVFDPAGSNAYLGTDSGLFGTKGLTVVNGSTSDVAQFTSAPGKVLAVSTSAKKVVISDTSPLDGPNQVFVFDTTSNTPVAYGITGATAADFSPDSLKAYIVAGSNLYLYSQLDALQTIPLSAPANDVSFLSEGAFAYVAGGNPAGMEVRWTCSGGLADTVATPGIPTLVMTLPGQGALGSSDTINTFHVLALNPPNISRISVNTTPEGCTPSVVDGPVASFNLGFGSFTASQLIVSQDGTTAYIVSPNLSSILVFNIAGETSSSIALTGNALPLSASLTPNGAYLYVGANDGNLHVIETAISADIQQIQFPLGICQNVAGQPFPGVTCNPDLVVVKP